MLVLCLMCLCLYMRSTANTACVCIRSWTCSPFMESGGLGDLTAFAPGPVAEEPGAPAGTATSPSKNPKDTIPSPGSSSALLGAQTTRTECRPRNGGRFCVGRRMKFRSCNTEPCPRGRKDFREEQCSQFDGKHFNINGLPPTVRWIPKYSGSEYPVFRKSPAPNASE